MNEKIRLDSCWPYNILISQLYTIPKEKLHTTTAFVEVFSQSTKPDFMKQQLQLQVSEDKTTCQSRVNYVIYLEILLSYFVMFSYISLLYWLKNLLCLNKVIATKGSLKMGLLREIHKCSLPRKRDFFKEKKGRW